MFRSAIFTILLILVSTAWTYSIPVPDHDTELDLDSEVMTSTIATTKTIIIHKHQRDPDDILNWFFHHSFKKMNQYLESHLELDEPDKVDETSQASSQLSSDENPSPSATPSISKWKIRVVKVFLKLMLVVLALVSATLFVVTVLLFMIIAFVIIKFICHVFQYCYESKKAVYRVKPRKSKMNTSSSYHVTL